MEEPESVLGLTVSAVAKRLGVAPATLRTWERRYGLGPSGRVAGARRRYTAPDLGRLDHMRRLTLTGVPPAEAARAALQGEDPPLSPGRPGGPGGRVLALPGADGGSRGLARAVLALDDRAVRELLVNALRERGVIDTWERMLAPVLRAVGDRWGGTGEGVEAEHLLTEAARFALLRVADDAAEPEPTRPALLACAEDEAHCLPVYALAAALAERRVPSRLLGGQLPADALVAAVRRTGPSSVFVWSQLPETADAAFVDELPATRPPTAVLLGGAGWAPEGLPPRATLVQDLGDAVHLVAVAAGLG